MFRQNDKTPYPVARHLSLSPADNINTAAPLRQLGFTTHQAEIATDNAVEPITALKSNENDITRSNIVVPYAPLPASLSSLPVELHHMIIDQIDSLDDLFSLLQACCQTYKTWSAYKVKFLREILLRSQWSPSRMATLIRLPPIPIKGLQIPNLEIWAPGSDLAKSCARQRRVERGDEVD